MLVMVVMIRDSIHNPRGTDVCCCVGAWYGEPSTSNQASIRSRALCRPGGGRRGDDGSRQRRGRELQRVCRRWSWQHYPDRGERGGRSMRVALPGYSANVPSLCVFQSNCLEGCSLYYNFYGSSTQRVSDIPACIRRRCFPWQCNSMSRSKSSTMKVKPV